MLDPLTALSLAGNIIQFVDFASKLFIKGREIYNSADGLSVGGQELQTIANDLQDLTSRLKNSSQSNTTDNSNQFGLTPKIDRRLLDLSTQCSSVADELIQALERLRLPDPTGRNRKWKSARHAFKTLWDKEKVYAIVERLNGLREAWNFRILVSLRDNLDVQGVQQLEGFTKLEQGTQHLAIRIQNDQRGLMDALEAHALTISAQDITTKDLIKFQHEWTRRAILESINDTKLVEAKKNAHSPEPEDGEKLRLVEEMLLESLRFTAMMDRFEDVQPAHQKTYEWIFKTPGTNPESLAPRWSDFPKWLAEGDGIYWINGKAASGKSTILRYICDNTENLTLLEKWAGQKSVIIASHFFWSSGIPEQRSYIGLLRALIFKILQQRRDLIPKVFPRQWAERRKYSVEAFKELNSISWTLSTLCRAFKRIFHICDTKFCLFIDGLDEYEGDAYDVIDLFTQLPAHVKICVSSRPLHDFATAFKSSPGLRLQDLTFGDIKRFVDDELETHPQMKELKLRTPVEAASLSSEIVNKADGVFLWVKLVVLSLIRGLRNSDQISDLRKRLTLLPPSLEELFSQIIGKLEPVYIQQSSRIFQIFAKAREHKLELSSLGLFFAENQDWNMLTLPAKCSLTDEDLVARCDIVDTWLRTRCGGLIEAHRDSKTYYRYNLRLEYLHRTVHEFLRIPEIQSRILSPTAGTRFSPSQALLQAALLYIKWVMHPIDSKTNPDFLKPESNTNIFSMVESALTCAYNAELETGEAQTLMLEELDRVCNSLYKGSSVPPYYWANESLYGTPGLYKLTIKNRTNHHNSIVSIAIESGLYLYVQRVICSNPYLITQKLGRPLLHYAVREYYNGQTSLSCVSEPIVEVLLTHGASPNEKYEGVSAWELILNSIFRTLGKLDITEKLLLMWARIARMFLFHGANMMQCLGDDPNKSAYQIITAVFYDRFTREANDLQRMLVPPSEMMQHLDRGVPSPRSSSSGSQEISFGLSDNDTIRKRPTLTYHFAPPSAQWTIKNAKKRMEYLSPSSKPTKIHTQASRTQKDHSYQLTIQPIYEQPQGSPTQNTPLLPTLQHLSSVSTQPHMENHQLSLSPIYNIISLG